MGLASGTVAHLPVSKSTSPSTSAKRPYWAHQRGLEAEFSVIQFFQKKSYHLLQQRLKTPYAEVDLLFMSPGGYLLMVEVKSVSSEAFIQHRISRRQKVRLLRAVQFLAAQFDKLVAVHWAFVSPGGEITLIEDISG